MQPGWNRQSMWGLLGLVELPLAAIYVRDLWPDPRYRGLILFVPVAAATLFALRWDRRVETPKSWRSRTWIALGIAASVIAVATLDRGWIAVGLLLTVGGFLTAHHESDGRNLLPIAWIFFGLLRLPWGADAWLMEHASRWIAFASKASLGMFRIPVLRESTFIRLPEYNVDVAQQLGTFWSWPWFLFVVLTYSALYRRSWLVTLLNWFSGLFWFLVCQVWIVWAGWWWGHREGVVFGAIAPVCVVIALLMFASTERGVRSLLQPIPDNTNQVRVINPWVALWNAIVRDRHVLRRRRHRTNRREARNLKPS